MTEKEFTATIGVLMLAGFKGNIPALVDKKELSPAGKLWYQALRNMPENVLKAAIADTCLNEEFFPAIATINRYAQAYLAADEIDGSEAWGKFKQEAVRVGGVYGTPEFPDDPCMLETIQIMGWRDICTCLEKDVPTLRAQMRDIYNSVKKRQKTKQRMEQLAIDPAGIKKIGGMMAGLPIKSMN